MTAVSFRVFKGNDYQPPLTLQEIFRLYGSWSGLHDFSFDDLLDSASITETGLVSGVWNVPSVWQTPQMPPSFEVRYHKTANRQGVAIRSQDQSLFYYVTTDSSGHPQIYQWSNTNLAQSLPKTTPEEADVRIVFRQQQDTDDQTQIWQSISVYMNGQLITTYNYPWNQVYTNLQVGFLAYGTDSVTYTNVELPELCDTAEFGTLDVGAVPTDGLQLTIEGRYLKYFVRFDGSLRAWKVKSIPSVYTYVAGQFYSNNIPADVSQLATHVQMMGAWLWSDAMDFSLAAQYGYRFAQVNNSMLLTKQECFLEAGNEIKRMKEIAFTETLDAPLIAALETEDRITTPDGSWIITQYTINLNYGELEQQMTIRQYEWD